MVPSQRRPGGCVVSARDDLPTLAKIAAWSHDKVALIDLHADACDALNRIDRLEAELAEARAVLDAVSAIPFDRQVDAW